MAYESAKTITEQGLESLGRYYSVYRAMVVNNTDPDHMNRIKVAIPEVMGGIVLWAYSKGQHGSTGSGFKMMAPKNGDIVYITFEYGDPSKPLWEYHGWAQNQIPDILDDPDTMGIVTPNGNRIWLNDKDGSLKMYLYGSATIYAEGPVSINSKAQAYVNASKVIVNQGNNDGIININELTQKLNQLVSEMESLKTQYNSHTHSGIQSGPAVSGPVITPVTKPFSTFNKTDYEDSKFVH